MLKTRLIPSLLFKDYSLVKSIQFGSLRILGNPAQTVKVYNARGVDELIFLDIGATADNKEPLFQVIADISEDCFMPFTVGGGIKTISQIRTLLKIGADKVALNTHAFRNPQLINKAARIFGNQSIIIAIDVKRVAPKKYEVFINGGTTPTGRSAIEWAQEAEQLGAGELFLTSIDRDGTMKGYDLEAIALIARAVGIPVIASGGAGKPQDFVNAIVKGHADAVSAASIFHYTQHTPASIKTYMYAHGIPVRQ